MFRKLVVLGLVALLAPAAALAGPINKIVVVGDSLSDQGNGFLATAGTFPPAPYAGRASNGPVAVERMAQQLGVSLTPSLAGGSNYAFLGAETGTANGAATTYGQPAIANTGMLTQLAAVLATGPVVDPAGTLFVVWGGPNDFFTAPTPAAAAAAVGNLSATIQALWALGARRFLVPNMPDLSLTPFGLALPPVLGGALQQLVLGFNAGLEGALGSLDGLPGIDIRRFDTFGFLTAVTANPGAFGFTNVTDPCLIGDLSGGLVSLCSTPGEFLFWDSVHPTSAAHHALGDAFASAAVPEPATLSLFGIGVAVSAAARRRAKRRAA